MKLPILTTFFLIITNSYTFSQSNTKNFIDKPYIELTGKVEKEIIPNQIYICITIDEQDNRGKISIEKQEDEMISKLEYLGINIEKNLVVKNFNGAFKRKFLSSNQVSKAKKYQLLVTKGEILGKVFLTLDEINISSFYVEKISHSEIKSIRRNAKIDALKIAKEKAVNYVNAINQSIGKAIFVQEIIIPNNNFNNIQSNSLDEINITGYGKRNKIYEIKNLDFQKIKISAAVLAKFELL